MRLEELKDTILQGHALRRLQDIPDNSVHLIITSPPYWGLRDYGHPDQIGMEPELQQYLDHLLQITAELHRVLRKDGALFWNHGDAYGGTGKKGDSRDPKYKNGRNAIDPPNRKYRPKCMTMQNYRLAMQMVDRQGWILRNIIIWHKPNAMPSSVKDRLNNTYEPVFFFTKSRRYYFNLDAIRVPYKDPRELKYRQQLDQQRDYEGKGYPQRIERKLGSGKNPGDVWDINTKPFRGAHFAVFPMELVERIIKAACPPGGIVLDPFMGSGTTALAALKNGCSFIGIELKQEYIQMALERIDPYLKTKTLDNWGGG